MRVGIDECCSISVFLYVYIILQELYAIGETSRTGVDYVSCGALTHSAPILDFSLKHLKQIL